MKPAIRLLGRIAFSLILTATTGAICKASQVVGWNANGAADDVPSSLSNVVALAAADSPFLAFTANANVMAWGDASGGQSDVPAGLSNVVAVTAGSTHSLALKADGHIVGWGAGITNSSNWPDFAQSTEPDGLSNVVAISAGGACS